MRRIILSIEGMTCSACSNGLEKYLNKQNGIINASVNLVMANATIDYDNNILTQNKIEIYIKQAGFKSLGIFKNFQPEKQIKSIKVNFIIFTFIALTLLYISMGEMLNLPITNFLSSKTNPQNYAISLLFLTILFLFYGKDILYNGYKNLIHKMPNMDSLVFLGVLSSFFYSLYSVYKIFNGESSYINYLYFDSSAIVIYFIKLGRYIQGISKDKTKEAIKKLVEITPNFAVIEVDGQTKKVTLDEIKKGNIVISKPSEYIAVDGEIIEGKTHLDESFITGESKQVSKGVGAKVIAGSLNYDGVIKYKAEKIGKESTISSIVRLVINASNTKVQISKLVDKVSSYFVPSVILIALLTFIFYLILGQTMAISIKTFVTILVVACPCSLGLATPLAIVIVEGICASKGILIKKSEILEICNKINTIVFDKTGTLTYGKLKISKIYNFSKLEENVLLHIVASLEENTNHPIANAFLAYSKENNFIKLQVKDFSAIYGYGIIGTINDDNYIVGSKNILAKYNIDNKYLSQENSLLQEGHTIVYVVKNNKIIALIGLKDILRKEAKELLKSLKEKQIKTIMLTGDNREIANQVGKELNFDEIYANILPTQKTEFIKNLQQKGHYVMMCGDGINDSPALATANIGLSIKNATEIALNSADVILINNNLKSILTLFNLSFNTIKNIKQNLFWAFFYNLLMIPIAMGLFSKIGLKLNPMLASLAMVLSSFSVIINALRLKNVNK